MNKTQFLTPDITINKVKENLSKEIWKKYLWIDKGDDYGYETDEDEFGEDKVFYENEGIPKLTLQQIDEMSLDEIINIAKKYIKAKDEFPIIYATDNHKTYISYINREIELLNEELQRLNNSPQDDERRDQLVNEIQNMKKKIPGPLLLDAELKQITPKYNDTLEKINTEIVNAENNSQELKDLYALQYVGQNKKIPSVLQYQISTHLAAGSKKKKNQQKKGKKTSRKGSRRKRRTRKTKRYSRM